jgi:pimeloyl-ACP methyl ester carboxylesterase
MCDWYLLCSIFLRLSFALAAKQIKGKARVVAMDLRGHGKSTTSDDLDLSIEVCPSLFTKLANLIDVYTFSYLLGALWLVDLCLSFWLFATADSYQ